MKNPTTIEQRRAAALRSLADRKPVRLVIPETGPSGDMPDRPAQAAVFLAARHQEEEQ
jgi:hypothetical protein